MSAGSIGQSIINGTYGLDNRPPTAFEELKAWCEKHLEPREYVILPETKSYGLSILLESEYEIGFYADGRFLNIWAADDDTYEHFQECEAYERAKRSTKKAEG